MGRDFPNEVPEGHLGISSVKERIWKAQYERNMNIRGLEKDVLAGAMNTVWGG